MKTQCCGYSVKKGKPWPVMWNEFNLVVQCHNFGTVYEPVTKLKPKKPRKPKKTWKEKGWWSPTEAFGPRAYDC